MKQQYFSNLFVLSAFFLLFGSVDLSAEKKEYVKTYEETYPISANGKVDLENRYGKINIRTWSKKEVNIKVAIKVNTGSDSQAESTFDRIKIDFSNSSSLVSAKTNIDSKKSFWNFLQRWWGDADLSIDYEVYMPESASLEVSNKYGDVQSASIQGEVIMEVKYGNFTLDHAADHLVIDLAYGNGVVARTNTATVDLAYGKLRINDANTVDIDSKFSKVTIESANKIESESGYDVYTLGDIGILVNNGKYDNVKIEKLEELQITTKYTNVEVNELLLSAFARQSYGGLKIRSVGPSLQGIDAEGKYTGIEIDLSGISTFQLQADTKYTSMHTPSGMQFTKQIKENNEQYIEAYKGDSNSAVMVKLSAQYGGLKLR